MATQRRPRKQFRYGEARSKLPFICLKSKRKNSPTIPVVHLALKDHNKNLTAKVSTRDSDSFFILELDDYSEFAYCVANNCGEELQYLEDTFGTINNTILHQNISVSYLDFPENNASDYFWFYRSNFTLDNNSDFNIYNYSFALVNLTNAKELENTSFVGYYNQLSFNPNNQNASINLEKITYSTLFDHLMREDHTQSEFLSIEFDSSREKGNLTLDNRQDFYDKQYMATQMINLQDYYDESIIEYRGNFIELTSFNISHGIVDYDQQLHTYNIPIFQKSSLSNKILVANVDIDNYALSLPTIYFSNILSFYQATYNESRKSYVFDCNLFNGQRDYLSFSVDGFYLNETDEKLFRRTIELPLSNFVTIETNVTTYANTSYDDYEIFQTKTCYFDNTKFTESQTSYASLGQVVLTSLKTAYDFERSLFAFTQLYNDDHWSVINYIDTP
ncbi:uncharacterized protein ASCRUDRAFT_10437 [Ascoidea rubescens DSM 1968]|uniref:Acid protease n=1 Tax=Ascoidea rubescens DSM 1968 TaxID=1344418 RepID=A0A1D2V9M4_9ASCO|nr:hypothetical protein ASCRUDRAFT_10437 [Ascoidea rubescens DSM 1968]ODV58173.1 hypothetical protein ASCRUDRAFT_10437 [Ascoidea rubescens DSM 1968]